ncbi:MAG TPA: ChbG/HpnK family deacetylase [Solirubrobacteraceae bacterium]|nr:ChbG/HpnK family deacetylase [Solirubrobacteraceae bacterium]
MSCGRRRLVVNADDFGRSAAINRGILRAHRDGIVTSASLMVRYPAAAQAASDAQFHPRLGVGLHFDLGEWEYRDGEWRSVYDVARTDDRAAVEAELVRQLEEFERLAGVSPTHIDSHQHVHRDEPVRSAVQRAADALGVPVRHAGGVRYCGGFYGQGRRGEPLPQLIAAEALVALVGRLEPGVTELACHPADGVDFESTYAAEREQELRALCDPRVAQALREHAVELCNFVEI